MRTFCLYNYHPHDAAHIEYSEILLTRCVSAVQYDPLQLWWGWVHIFIRLLELSTVLVPYYETPSSCLMAILQKYCLLDVRLFDLIIIRLRWRWFLD